MACDDLLIVGVADRDTVRRPIDLILVGRILVEGVVELVDVGGGRPSLDVLDEHDQIGVELAAIHWPNDGLVRP